MKGGILLKFGRQVHKIRLEQIPIEPFDIAMDEIIAE